MKEILCTVAGTQAIELHRNRLRNTQESYFTYENDEDPEIDPGISRA
jgi:hypothetical protein